MKSSVTYPMGFTAGSAKSGLKKDGKLDLCLIVSDRICSSAGIFTTNVIKGHSLMLCQKNIKSGKAKCVYVNAGNANACVGSLGLQDAKQICKSISKYLNCKEDEVLPCSTGVIGTRLPMDKIESGIKSAYENLSSNGGENAAYAIMTTDTHPKCVQKEIIINNKPVRIGAVAKGSGMIHPNMATMISIITTDAQIDTSLLQKMLKKCSDLTYNRVSVDGDTSVCDTVLMLANGMSDVEIKNNNDIFFNALVDVCTKLSKMLAKDGEGATKLMIIEVKSAPDDMAAKLIANAIAKSPLCKTAAFGEDANWGRILTAAGYSGADFDPSLCELYIGSVLVYQKGTGIIFDEKKAKCELSKDEIVYTLIMNQGQGEYNVWSCDFSYDYIKINGSYRT